MFVSFENVSYPDRSGRESSRARTGLSENSRAWVHCESFCLLYKQQQQNTGAPNGSVPQNICSSGTFLPAGRCERNNSPWKESVAGKKIIQGVRGDLKFRIAATGYLYGLLTTQDLNCALWNFPVSQVAGCKVAGWELFHQSWWEWGTDNFFPAISQNA